MKRAETGCASYCCQPSATQSRACFLSVTDFVEGPVRMTAMKPGSRHWLIFLVSAMALSTGVAHAAIRSAPVRPIVIATPDLSVVLDPLDGLPYQYRFGKATSGARIPALRMTAILCRIKPRSYSTMTLTPTSSKVGRADRQLLLPRQPTRVEPAASFDLRYSLNGASLTLSMEQVREQPGL